VGRFRDGASIATSQKNVALSDESHNNTGGGGGRGGERNEKRRKKSKAL